MDWPKCEAHKNAEFCGDEYWECQKGRKITWHHDNKTRKKIYEDLGPCAACNGTGEAAKLTADEAAEYLFDENIPWIPWRTIDGQVQIEYEYDLASYWETADSLTAALNAAARAVKERGKECPPK